MWFFLPLVIFALEGSLGGILRFTSVRIFYVLSRLSYGSVSEINSA